jgi:ketosteroid isomerase-like protein
MSEENVDVVQRGFDRFFDGDFDGWLQLVHPEIGWDIFTKQPPCVGVGSLWTAIWSSVGRCMTDR